MSDRTAAPGRTETRRVRRVSLPWRYAAIGTLGSLTVAVGAALLLTLGVGTPLYLGIAILTALIAPLLTVIAFFEGRRTASLIAQSHTDALTGVGNLRELHVRLEQELARCSRGGGPLTLLMIDVDDLKRINDSAGHRAGDQALQTVAGALQRVTRVSDVVGRYGGDEFWVIAPETTEQAARALAERIIGELQHPPKGAGTEMEVSVSIGIATAPPAGADSPTLLETADRFMYAGKAMGGGRIVSAHGPT